MTKEEKVMLEDYGSTSNYLSQCEEAIEELISNWAVAVLVHECEELAVRKAELLAMLGMSENDARGEYLKIFGKSKGSEC